MDEKLVEKIVSELELNDVGEINLKYFIRVCRLMIEWRRSLEELLGDE